MDLLNICLNFCTSVKINFKLNLELLDLFKRCQKILHHQILLLYPFRYQTRQGWRLVYNNFTILIPYLFYSSRILLIHHSISRNFQLVIVKTKRSETFFVYRHYLQFKNIPVLKQIMELTHENIKLRKAGKYYLRQVEVVSCLIALQ